MRFPDTPARALAPAMLLAIAAVAAPRRMSAQIATTTPTHGTQGASTSSAGTVTATNVVAMRTGRAPTIDGRDDDPIWQEAPAVTSFREFDPVEGGDPRFRTEFKVAYDSRNIYVFVRAYDPDPNQIRRLLARRDVRAPSDQIKVMIDSYHDGRTGYEFAVNPGRAKRDYAMYNDNSEDISWDGVWDVATTVDSLGWTAEFAIPMSQLGLTNARTHTIGFAVWRDIDRFKERVSWPLYRQSRAGISSQLGT